MDSFSLEDELRSQTAEPVVEKRRNPRLLRAVGIVALIVLFGLVFVYSRNLFGGFVSNSPTATELEAFRTLPPTWTPGGLSSGASTPQPDIPGNQIPTELLDQAALNRLALIGQQVDLVRDLPTPGSVPPILVKSEELGNLLNELYGEDVLAIRERDEGLLRALGFLDTSQTLADYGLSAFGDPYGAVYADSPARVYLIGSEFSDLLAYAYARQYGHAISADAFGSQIVTASDCSILSDSCRAARAVANGDWELTGEQWLSAYASASVFEQAESAAPAQMLAQTEPPSDFAIADLEFIAQSGLDFVSAVFNAGGWEAVDALYAAPPTTSEQIIHPEKFTANEQAVAVSDADLSTTLGAEWSVMGQGGLGEWLTYLMLTQGANPAARIDPVIASEAAAGWGGDNFHVYVHEGDGLLVSSLHWAMESDAHAIDLQDGLAQLMTLRFTAASSARGTGACWQNEAERVCLFRNGDEVLQVQTPDDAAMMDVVLGHFADFR
jgi:hypothetical protein